MRVEPIKGNESLEGETVQRRKAGSGGLNPGEFTKGGIKEAGKEWSREKRKLQHCGSGEPNVPRAFTSRAPGIQQGKTSQSLRALSMPTVCHHEGRSVTPPSSDTEERASNGFSPFSSLIMCQPSPGLSRVNPRSP